MSSKWNIEFYEDDQCNCPVADYIKGVNDPKQRALLLRVIKHLQDLGTELQGTKMDKLIEGSIRELRKDRHRILYGRYGDTFVLLTAFLKRTDKTPIEQINLAKQRFDEYKNKHNL